MNLAKVSEPSQGCKGSHRPSAWLFAGKVGGTTERVAFVPVWMRAFLFSGRVAVVFPKTTATRRRIVMTELLYPTDSYLQTFETIVTEQVEGGVVLDQTAFYPGGGG